MANELVQILLNTLEPDTLVVKNSQIQLEKLESNAEFPLVLGQIICESQNHPKQLDLISVTTLARALKHYYKGHNEQVQAQICEMLMKLLEVSANIKVINEVILIFQRIVTIEYPGSLAFKVILSNFTEEKLTNLGKFTPFRKFVYLKLYYKCIKGIHGETKTPEQLADFRAQIDPITSQPLIVLMRELFNDLSMLEVELEKIQGQDPSALESVVSDLFNRFSQSYFFESARFVFKIYSFYNLTSRYTALGDFNVVVLSKHFHKLYKMISSLLINSGLLNKMQSSQELENILKLIYVTEKHLMKSVEHRILKVEDLEVIFEHLIAIYFDNNEQLMFYGEKFVNYNQLSDVKYLTMVCETRIYSQMKFHEERLLTNCINTISTILVNFGFSTEDLIDLNAKSQKDGEFVQKMFMSRLELILKKVIDQILIIDVKDLYTLKTDPEEYYATINRDMDEEFYLREAAKALLKHISEFIGEEILINLGQQVLIELTNFSIENIREFRQILRRESNYYVMNRIYGTVKNDIDYEAMIIELAKIDFQVQDSNYDIVKIQLLQLIKNYVQKAYSLGPDFSKAIFELVYNLICQKSTSNICMILLALGILLRLIEVNTSFVALIPEIAEPIFNLCKEISNVESKLTIFEFFEYSILGDFPQYYGIIWEICEESYKSCRDTSIDTMNLKSKVINLLIKLIETTDVEYQKVPFIISILEECIQEDDDPEILTFLTEGGFHLFGKLVMKLNIQQISGECVQKLARLIQLVGKFAMIQWDYIPLTVVILENCLLADIEIINQVIAQSLSQAIPVWFNDLKETSLKYLFDIAELYLRIDKNNRVEFSLHLFEQILHFMKASAETSLAFMIGLLRVLGRLAFEDVETLHSVLNALSPKLGVADCRYSLLSTFYEFLKEETVYSSYYIKKSFVFYAFAILSAYLKELEANDGINFNQMALSSNNIFENDFKMILEVFCKCLSELYAYDSNQLELVTPEIYENVQVMMDEDTYLRGNEFDLKMFKNFKQFVYNDQMRSFDIYSQVKNTLSNNLVILNDPDCKAILEREVKF